MSYRDEKRVIAADADVYDTLELIAYAYGGVGATWFYSDSKDAVFPHKYWGDPDACPLCIVGFGQFAEIFQEKCDYHGLFDAVANDVAVRCINKRKGIEPDHSRVSFEEYCAERNIVRTPQSTEAEAASD